MKSVTIAEANSLWLSRIRNNKKILEEVSLAEAFNRVLGENISASIAIPGFNKSAVDGYAINTTLQNMVTENHEPQLFSIIGRIGAGEVWSKPVQA